MRRRAHNQQQSDQCPQRRRARLADEVRLARARTGVAHRRRRARNAHAPWGTRARPQQRPPLTPRHAGVQRLEVLVAVMLARERRALADAEDGGCTELAAALATLPSGLLEMVADAVAALGHADA